MRGFLSACFGRPPGAEDVSGEVRRAAQHNEALRSFVDSLKAALEGGAENQDAQEAVRSNALLGEALGLIQASAGKQRDLAEQEQSRKPQQAVHEPLQHAIETMLCCLPGGAIITVFSARDGAVLYQNQASVEYMGKLTASLAHPTDAGFTLLGPGPQTELHLAELPAQHPLRILFGSSSAARLLQRTQLLAGEPFRQLLAVPYSMRQAPHPNGSQCQVAVPGDSACPGPPQRLTPAQHPPINSGSLLGSLLWNDALPRVDSVPQGEQALAASSGRMALKQRFFSVKAIRPSASGADELPAATEAAPGLSPVSSKPAAVAGRADAGTSSGAAAATLQPAAAAAPSVSALPAAKHPARRNTSFLRIPYRSGLPTTTEDAVLPPSPPAMAAGPTDALPVGRSWYPNGAAALPAGSNTSASSSVAPVSLEDRALCDPGAGQNSDEEPRPSAKPAPPPQEMPSAVIVQRRQRLRSSSVSTLNPQVLASKLRSLSLTNWDKRAQFLMPQVRVNTEDAVSRQLQLAYVVLDDSTSVNSTAPPSEPMSDARLTQHSSLDNHHSGSASSYLPGSRSAMIRASLRASACGQFPIGEIREEEAVASSQALPSGTAVLGHGDGEDEVISPASISALHSERLSEVVAALSTAGGTAGLVLRQGRMAPMVARPHSSTQLMTSMGPGVASLTRPRAQDAPGSPASPAQAEHSASIVTSSTLPAADSCSLPMPTFRAEATPCNGAGQSTALNGHQHQLPSPFSPSASQHPVENVSPGASQPQQLAPAHTANQPRESESVNPYLQGGALRPDASLPVTRGSASATRYKRSATLEKLSRMLARPFAAERQGTALQDALQIASGSARNHSMPAMRPLMSASTPSEHGSSCAAANVQDLQALQLPRRLEAESRPAFGPSASGRRPNLGAEADALAQGAGLSTMHEVCLQLVPAGTGGIEQPVLVLTQHELRHRMSGMLLQLLREEHKLLESIFPRHVLKHIVKRVRAGLHGLPAGALDGPGTMSGMPPNFEHHPTMSRQLQLDPGLPAMVGPAAYHSMVTIAFCDIVGFTSMCKSVEPIVVMDFLNSLYSKFDELSDIYCCYKVETIGDCYMTASGLIEPPAKSRRTLNVSDDEKARMSALKAISFARALLLEATTVLMPKTNRTVQLRVGLHSGPVVSGIVGKKQPRCCLFGDSVNTASRMESTCPTETIQISHDTWQLLDAAERSRWVPTGGVQVKGKGQLLTYTWNWHTEAALRYSN